MSAQWITSGSLTVTDVALGMAGRRRLRFSECAMDALYRRR
jgi:hypothetical protein